VINESDDVPLARRYWKVSLGRSGLYADELIAAGELGVDFTGSVDLTEDIPLPYSNFQAQLKPVARAYQESRGGKATPTSVGLAVGNLWSAVADIRIGDIVVTRSPSGAFAIGVVSGPYRFDETGFPPHRRAVDWRAARFSIDDVSSTLRAAITLPQTVYRLDPYSAELDALLDPQLDGGRGSAIWVGSAVSSRPPTKKWRG
jgi:predicted Mrr-cat superfamily restriction endonuclease